MAADLTPAPLPRSTSADRRQPKPTRGNFELYAWVFMRISGVLLVLLVLGHFAIMHVIDGGLDRSTSRSCPAAGPTRSGGSTTSPCSPWPSSTAATACG